MVQGVVALNVQFASDKCSIILRRVHGSADALSHKCTQTSGAVTELSDLQCTALNCYLAYYCSGCQTDPEIVIKTTYPDKILVVRSQVQTVINQLMRIHEPEALAL